MTDREPETPYEPELAAPARITRDTLVGCMGIVCVLLVLPVLWISLGSVPSWLARAMPVVAFALAVTGAALILRVPARLVARSADPRRPLTHVGIAPMREQPASRGNRISLFSAIVMLLAASLGYVAEIEWPGAWALPWGLALAVSAGVGLVTQGALVAARKTPTPALRWARVTIYGGAMRESGALLAVGFISIGASLFLALFDGYWWGAAGLALLVLTLVLIAPLARRAPRLPRQRMEAGGDDDGAQG